MPCTYTGSLEGDRIMLAEDSAKAARDELDRVTSYLCALCTYLESTERDVEETLTHAAHDKQMPVYSIFDWWTGHKLTDLKKQQQEEITKDKERASNLAAYEKLKKELGL